MENSKITIPGFKEHISTLSQVYDTAAERLHWDVIIVGSGSPICRPFDDVEYEFSVNPYFRHWLPLLDVPDCFILYSPGKGKPTLYFNSTSSIWRPDYLLPNEVDQCVFDIQSIDGRLDLKSLLFSGNQRIAYIGSPRDKLLNAELTVINPENLISHLDYFRAYKDDYELQCIRMSNRRAIRGHSSVKKLFLQGASEFELQLDFLRATKQTENQLPYRSIIGINENSAILHYRDAIHSPTSRSRSIGRSMLIDAGAYFRGYTSDITRTYSDKNNIFSDLISAVDRIQQGIIEKISNGIFFVDLHAEYHCRLGGILADFGIVNCSSDSCFESGITRTFFPHGLGHLIGLQVHDKGGMLVSEDGDTRRPPKIYSSLRMTRKIEPGQVFTIEPGLYFIPALLNELRQGKYCSEINWSKVDTLIPFGGIRIEDNVHLNPCGEVENITRDAFEQEHIE